MKILVQFLFASSLGLRWGRVSWQEEYMEEKTAYLMEARKLWVGVEN